MKSSAAESSTAKRNSHPVGSVRGQARHGRISSSASALKWGLLTHPHQSSLRISMPSRTGVCEQRGEHGEERRRRRALRVRRCASKAAIVGDGSVGEEKIQSCRRPRAGVRSEDSTEAPTRVLYLAHYLPRKPRRARSRGKARSGTVYGKADYGTLGEGQRGNYTATGAAGAMRPLPTSWRLFVRT